MGISWEPNLKQEYPRFNLPCRLTCPNRTPECSRVCYAYKAERQWPTVRVQREQNYLLSQAKRFPHWIIQELDARATRPTIFRIHESGDFYSPAYYQSWVTIAKALPWVQFYAFTKVFDLFALRQPKNLLLIASQFYDEARPVPRRTPVFQTVRKGDTGIGVHCHGACDACGICPYATSKTRVWAEVH